MATKKKVAAPAPGPSITDTLDAINAKFDEYKAVMAEIEKVHGLYAKASALKKELLPLFVLKDKDSFLITREIKVGSKTHRFTPGFYDTEKDIIKDKSWKSCPFDIGAIE